MKLTKDLKVKIDKYFENISVEELYDKLLKYKDEYDRKRAFEILNGIKSVSTKQRTYVF